MELSSSMLQLFLGICMIHLESNMTCIRYMQLQLLAVAFSFFGLWAEKVSVKARLLLSVYLNTAHCCIMLFFAYSFHVLYSYLRHVGYWLRLSVTSYLISGTYLSKIFYAWSIELTGKIHDCRGFLLLLFQP